MLKAIVDNYVVKIWMGKKVDYKGIVFFQSRFYHFDEIENGNGECVKQTDNNPTKEQKFSLYLIVNWINVHQIVFFKILCWQARHISVSTVYILCFFSAMSFSAFI